MLGIFHYFTTYLKNPFTSSVFKNTQGVASHGNGNMNCDLKSTWRFKCFFQYYFKVYWDEIRLKNVMINYFKL